MHKMLNEAGVVLKNEQLNETLYIMEIISPKIARNIEPGQFVHMKIPGMEAHILRRPFSVYATSSQKGTLEILYQVVGFGSSHMTTLGNGEAVELIGPIGNMWQIPKDAKRALLVGGGVGAAPLFMLAESLIEYNVEVDVILGAQTKDALVCHDRYQELLAMHMLPHDNLRCATDDGTFGHAGFCTSLVEENLERRTYDYGAVCGPEPMMKIVAARMMEAKVPAQVSLEKRMACGVGACLSCVVETTQGVKRACVDGPIFAAEEVVF